MNQKRFTQNRLSRTWETGRPVIAGILVIMLISLAVSGWSPTKLLGKFAEPSRPGLAVGAAQTASLTIPTEPSTIADIVDAVGPAVVKVQTKSVSSSGVFRDGPFLFYGGGPRVTQGLGSGFIISADGYVLTNQHVVEGASQIQVAVRGYSDPFTAQVVGSDHELDLAVLKIDSSDSLPYLQFGNSESTRVGEWVIAIGNPGGLDHTVTVGVISAKGRPITIEDRNYRNLLQTDASINPGNSGGPLLNLQGQVVGVNTAVSVNAQGIGFAIPSSTVQGVIDQLISSGRVSHPFMGVSVSSVDSEMAQRLGMSGTGGAIVQQVVAGSPAQKAGITQGDVILAINGNPVKTPDDVVEQIAGYSVGEQVTVKLLRDGGEMEIKVTLAQKGV
ncbi:MAG: PDZ domain-containing protein [Firmicutes bacterium]|nr:PDZ domain-containing protein [Bacillota bacterium]